MKLFILATSVLSQITHEREVGQERTESDAVCYLRGEVEEDQCCKFKDDSCRGCSAALLYAGIACRDQQENGCWCDGYCMGSGDCCADHNDTCAFLQDYPPTTTLDTYSTTTDYTTTVPPSCTGFVQMPVHSLVTAKRAKKVCRLLGGHLAYFDNEAELDKFNELDLEVSGWLGMRRTKNGKHFIDVANREKIKVANWIHGDPNNANGDESCVVAFTSKWIVDPGKWKDVNCNHLNRPICRFEDPIYCK